LKLQPGNLHEKANDDQESENLFVTGEFSMATWKVYKGVVRQGRILLTPPVDLPESSEVYVVVMGEAGEETADSEDDRRQLAIAAVEEYIRQSSSSSTSSA
jgi:hypothetical protein